MLVRLDFADVAVCFTVSLVNIGHGEGMQLTLHTEYDPFVSIPGWSTGPVGWAVKLIIIWSWGFDSRCQKAGAWGQTSNWGLATSSALACASNYRDYPAGRADQSHHELMITSICVAKTM